MQARQRLDLTSDRPNRRFQSLLNGVCVRVDNAPIVLLASHDECVESARTAGSPHSVSKSIKVDSSGTQKNSHDAKMRQCQQRISLIRVERVHD